MIFCERKQNDEPGPQSQAALFFSVKGARAHTPEATHQHLSDELVTMLHESFQKSDILLAKLRKELAHG
jgi:type I restriction enzyme M protein